MVAAKKKSAKAAEDGEIFSASTFSSLGLHSNLCDQLQERLGFKGPTLVQAQAIPVILSGRHVLVNAATGTGKTVAYLAPVVHHLLSLQQPRIQRSDGTFALVLVPTRELCLQVHEILHKLLHRFHWIVPGYVMGGEKREKEKARLRKGISILVATPGRLLDHLKHTSSFSHTNLRWIIFDEADRILELGFGKEIEEILDLLGSRKHAKDSGASSKFEFQRQNLLLSATLNEKVNHLAKMSLEKPVLIGMPDKKMRSITKFEPLGSSDSDTEEPQYSVKATGSTNEDYKLPAQLTQRYVKVPCNARLAVLLSILKHLFERETSEKIVLFFSTCDAVDFHYSLLSEFQFKPNSGPGSELKQKFLRCKTFRLHGNMEQVDRRTTFETFKTEKSALLLSTDVSARGLDFPKVRCIIQYDSPGEATEYVHRVGRTARLGERGDSILFLQPIEIDYLKELEKHGVSLVEYPLLKVLDSFPLYGQQHVRKFVYIDAHPWVLALQKALEAFTDQPNIKPLAKNAFCSWVRAYTAHRGELKRIFVAKKLHLGHVAKSFALKEQPSLVGGSFHKQAQKRKRDERQKGGMKKRKFNRKT
ncbi:DEAD-box ATP-dependent RNA helicase 17 [Rosa rugosa]|uniref:DEAD-box ATP-dependent RNA helicase 17 n=1 Tax=Rosa rugosa TaxID=74645 RepID=UPI002B4037FF|nr:DEAD-box ATP-dependent RNA helicase 17 [Rosa rugosa]